MPPAATSTSSGRAEVIEGLLAELPKTAWMDRAELVFVRYPDGTVRAFKPEEWPPEAGTTGGRVASRRRADGTIEEYDPAPEIRALAGPDGIMTRPDGTRVRFVFTDAGAR
jgi:hypothetical protein